jgi:hypothetical protein
MGGICRNSPLNLRELTQSLLLIFRSESDKLRLRAKHLLDPQMLCPTH